MGEREKKRKMLTNRDHHTQLLSRLFEFMRDSRPKFPLPDEKSVIVVINNADAHVTSRGEAGN